MTSADQGREEELAEDMEAERRRLRREVLARRLAVPEATRHRWSLAIARYLEMSEPYGSSDVVLAYVSFRQEVDTAPIMVGLLARGKLLVLPRVERGAHALRLYQVRDLQRDVAPGYQGILEPVPGRCPEVAPERVDLVLVPGVVFDRLGYRLGYGGGYYDRLLATMPGALRVGLAFSLQVVDRLPVFPHDQPLHLLVCEHGVLDFRR